MPPHDEDSSDSDIGDYSTTNVLLGYASKEPTDDSFSQLGGYPVWLDSSAPPSASLAKCRSCRNAMSLLLQLNGDLPDRFPGHERRLYVFGCRGKTCQKKDGSIKAIRGVRVSKTFSRATTKKLPLESSKEETMPASPPQNLGNAIFSPNPFSSSGTSNPFSTSSTTDQNPFSSTSTSNSFQNSSLASKLPQKPASVATETSNSTAPASDFPSLSSKPPRSDLPTSFARAVSLSSPSSPPPTPIPSEPYEPWPSLQSLPSPYPSYHLDAEYEALSSATPDSSSAPRISNLDIDESGGGGSKGDEGAYESEIDKTFQRFADRLAQNPEQVLRYEFGGSPLLYSNSDAVGRLFSSSHTSSTAKVNVAPARPVAISGCERCGSERVFELQLTPHAILELEGEDEGTGMDGMEWGAIMVGTCAKDCELVPAGEVGYGEEWVGVQWEESGKGGGR